MDLMKPEAYVLSNVVKYQNGTIVSKLMINKHHGTVTVFAFDKDQALSEHSAPYDALVMVLDGIAEITISKEKYTLKTGEMILMPANDPHAVLALEKMKMMLVMIKE
jgi:quercetin dioxygenase-like cupin family protein